jgi:hypothetical protein
MASRCYGGKRVRTAVAFFLLAVKKTSLPDSHHPRPSNRGGGHRNGLRPCGPSGRGRPYSLPTFSPFERFSFLTDRRASMQAGRMAGGGNENCPEIRGCMTISPTPHAPHYVVTLVDRLRAGSAASRRPLQPANSLLPAAGSPFDRLVASDSRALHP